MPGLILSCENLSTKEQMQSFNGQCEYPANLFRKRLKVRLKAELFIRIPYITGCPPVNGYISPPINRIDPKPTRVYLSIVSGSIVFCTRNDMAKKVVVRPNYNKLATHVDSMANKSIILTRSFDLSRLLYVVAGPQSFCGGYLQFIRRKSSVRCRLLLLVEGISPSPSMIFC